MRVLRRRLVLLASIFLSITSILGSSDLALGQAGGVTPSADQIEMFKNLSPDQQQSILQTLGGSSGAGASGLGGLSGLLGGSSSSGSRLGQNSDLLESLSSRNRRPSEQDEGAQEPLIPVFKADDWVIIEIDFHLPPRPLPSTAAFASAMGQQTPSAQNIQAYEAAALAAQSGGATQAQIPPAPTTSANSAPPGFSSLVEPSEEADGQDGQRDRDVRRLRELIDLIRQKNKIKRRRKETIMNRTEQIG